MFILFDSPYRSISGDFFLHCLSSYYLLYYIFCKNVHLANDGLPNMKNINTDIFISTKYQLIRKVCFVINLFEIKSQQIRDNIIGYI